MGASRNLLLLSNSTLHPTGYLEYAAEYICDFLKSRNVTEVLFVPYALRNQVFFRKEIGHNDGF